MKIMLVLLLAVGCNAQILAPIISGGAYPPISLDGGTTCAGGGICGSASATGNGVITSLTVSSLSGTPTAGDTIICAWKFPNSVSMWTEVTDTVNAGGYITFENAASDSTNNAKTGLAVMYNAVATNPAITLKMSAAPASGVIAMRCSAWQNIANHGIDPSVYQQTKASSGANPSPGSALTPTASNELIIGELEAAGANTPSAGSGYAVYDSDGTNRLFVENQIQTTATATAANWTLASTAWDAQQFGFYQNTGGFCDIDGILDWSGGNASTGSLVTVALLGSGINPAAVGTYGNLLWKLTGTGGVAFDTSWSGHLSTARNCPFFSGVGSGTVGGSFATSSGLNQEASAFFGNSLGPAPGSGAGHTRVAFCWAGDIPNSVTSGANDPFLLSAQNNGAGYDYLALNYNYATGHWTLGLEAKSAGSPSRLQYNTPGQKVWFNFDYAHDDAGVSHQMRIWTCPNQTAGQDCGAITVGTAPTFGTITNTSVASNYPAANFTVGASAMSTASAATGWHYCSPVLVAHNATSDILP